MPMPIAGESSLYKVVHSLRQLWQLAQGLPSSVTALEATRWERIGRVVVSTSTAQINFPLSAVYRSIRISASGVRYVTNGVAANVTVQLSDDGGSSFLTPESLFTSSTNGAFGTASGAVGAAVPAGVVSSVNTNSRGSGWAMMDGTEQAGDVNFESRGMAADGAGHRLQTVHGRYLSAGGPIDYVRLQTGGSNIDLGTFIVEGLRG